MQGDITYDNNELISRVAEGDEKAFQIIFNRFYAPLCYYSQKIIGDANQDIVIEVFAKLWQKRTELTTVSHFKSFLFTSVRNACLDLIRKNRVLEVIGPVTELQVQEEATGLDNEELYMKVLAEVYAEIEKLPVQCREIFKLLYIQQLSTQEVADRLNLSVQTVRNQKTRALQLLRESLKKDIFLLVVFTWAASLY